MPDQAYTAQLIARITEGKLLPGKDPDAPVYHLVIDSRRTASISHDVFFALVTKRNDGHRYISDLIRKGVRHFVISREPKESWLDSGANFIWVQNTMEALQALASYHRGRFGMDVIGITGSNGKTIIKEWLWQLIGNTKNVVRNPKSFNSQIGVPLSVWQMNETHELGIFEAGISMPGEMERLEKVIQPTIGIFTNLGPAHDENFGSAKEKAIEKLQLFKNCKALICCSDHNEILEAFRELNWPTKPQLMSWSRHGSGNLNIIACEKELDRTTIQADFNGERLQVLIPFSDEASIENVMHCWLTMLYLGFLNPFIAKGIKSLHPLDMRLTLKEGINNCSLIDDSYSSDLASLGIALDFLQQQNQHRQKIVILSDMLQSGRSEMELYSEIGQLIRVKDIDRFIGVGQAIQRQKQFFSDSSEFFSATDDLVQALPSLNLSHASILIKGARVFEFEKIIQQLQQKTHETTLEVNLDGLIHNLNYYRSKLKPGVKTMAMVKAFSYGSGSFEIANVLQFHRVDYLAVAYADEGIALRKAGIRLPIMVMNPEEQSYEGIFAYNLESEVYNFRTLTMLEQAMERSGMALGSPVKIHIKLDTGMHRLGFDENDLENLVARLRNSNLRVVSAFSHLAASDDPNHDAFTNEQIHSFARMCEKLEKGIGYSFLGHILNSAGISRFPVSQFDMVRLGIGLYGISNLQEDQAFLQPVSSLKSIISQIKFIKAGSTIGYNREFKAERDMRIAIVPVGYADGLQRSLSNGKYHFLVHGKKVPITGNISMDMCMVDITEVTAQEGDEVIIFSKDHPITEMAKAMHTIPYEVLTGISGRVKRVYFHET